jgi:hypothetical protein
MDFLANFSMTEKMLCKQKMLSKEPSCPRDLAGESQLGVHCMRQQE